MEEMIKAYEIRVESLRVKEHLEDIGIDCRIILKLIFK
jgi:hypothetical protein